MVPLLGEKVGVASFCFTVKVAVVTSLVRHPGCICTTRITYEAAVLVLEVQLWLKPLEREVSAPPDISDGVFPLIEYLIH
jgi:hypothetical protein